MNPYDDGISMDTFVDWLVEAGYPIARVPGVRGVAGAVRDVAAGAAREAAPGVAAAAAAQLPEARHPINGSLAPADHFRAAVQEAKIGPDKDIPHLSAPVIVKYVTDLELLGLL